MTAIKFISGSLLLVLGIISSYTDLKNNFISNRLLFVFLIVSSVLDAVFFGFFSRDLIKAFLINVLSVLFFAAVLYISHSIAGGDCKLMAVMALLYPSSCYVSYGGNSYTLLFAAAFSLIVGYFYLLADSVVALVRKKNTLKTQDIREYMLSFFKNFFAVEVYMAFLNLLLEFLAGKNITMNTWLLRLFCIILSWLIGSFSFFSSWYVLAVLCSADTVFSFVFRTLPFTTDFLSYLAPAAMLLCHIAIRTNLYEMIPVGSLRKGMILTNLTSVLMQNSRVKGLPPVSTEDLSCRLTQEQTDSVIRWAKYRKIEKISIVRKIHFALFVFAGYVFYFILWSVS